MTSVTPVEPRRDYVVEFFTWLGKHKFVSYVVGLAIAMAAMMALEYLGRTGVMR